MAVDGLVQSAELRAMENQSEEKLPEVIIHENGVKLELENAPNGRSSIVNSPDSAAEFMQNDSLVLSNPSLVSDFKQKVDLSWENINVEVELPKPSFLKRCFNKSDEPTKPAFKQILFDVTGKIEPGTLLAVMGASGAGKTTLMNVLANQNIGSLNRSGSIKVNGQEIGKKIKTISAYVQQEDLFIGTLTVREHLVFQAILRIDKSVSKKDKIARADKVIHELGLTKCKDTVIGIPGRIRGISGGEMKRLAFASEVLTNPSLLFVDEPTSGIDSFMALSVIAALQKMADQGRTILTTIHQPSSEVYSMFHKVLLMSEGRVAYMGKTTDALPFFASLDYPCPANYNPADHYISTLAIMPGNEEECLARSKKICDAFDEMAAIHHKSKQEFVASSSDAKLDRPSYKVGFFRQLASVLWRASVSNKREPFVSTIKTVQIIVISIIAGLVYLQQDNDQDSIQNITGAIFFIVTTASFNQLQGAILVFPAEFPVFLKEHKLGMYRADVYFLSKILAELPWNIFGPFIFSTIVYWMIGLSAKFEQFIVFVCIVLLLTQCALSYGYLVSTISPTVQVATALAVPMMLPFLLFGGFFLKDSSVPVYFIWLKYLSWFKYSFEAASINQWETFGSIGGCATAVNSTTGTPCLPDGKAVLKFYSINPDRFGFDIGMMCALIIGYRVLAFIFLLIRASKK